MEKPIQIMGSLPQLAAQAVDHGVPINVVPVGIAHGHAWPRFGNPAAVPSPLSCSCQAPAGQMPGRNGIG